MVIAYVYHVLFVFKNLCNNIYVFIMTYNL